MAEQMARLEDCFDYLQLDEDQSLDAKDEKCATAIFETIRNMTEEQKLVLIVGDSNTQSDVITAMKKLTEEDRKQLNKFFKMQKQGSKEEGTDAAHILGVHVFQKILAKLPGRPIINDETKTKVMEIINGKDNLRIKSRYGNRSVDVIIEMELINYKRGDLLSAAAAKHARRIYQKYKDSDVPALKRVAESIGKMEQKNKETGRRRQVAYSSAPVAPEVDMRSAATRNGELRFCNDGTVDQRSTAYKQGKALVRADGHLDKRSEIVRNGEVKIKPSATSSSPAHTSSSSSSGRGSGSGSGSGSSGSSGTFVSGYTRSNGTQVSGYYRKN